MENSAKWHFQRNLQHFALAPFIGSCPGNLPLPSGIKTRMRNRKRLQPTILAEIRIPIAYLSFSGFLPQEKDSFRKKALLKNSLILSMCLKKAIFRDILWDFIILRHYPIMKTYTRLVIFSLAALLSFVGIIASAVFYAELQHCKSLQNNSAFLLVAASQMQSDDVEFPSYNYDTVSRTLNRTTGTRLSHPVRPTVLLKQTRLLTDSLSTRTSFAPPTNARLQLRTWLSPRLKARADPSAAQHFSVA